MHLWELTGFPFVPIKASSAAATSDNDGLQRASFFCNPKKCIHRALGAGNYIFYNSYAYCQQFIHIFNGKNIKFKQTHTNLVSTLAFPPRSYLFNFVIAPLAPVSWEVFFCVLHFFPICNKCCPLVCIHTKRASSLPIHLILFFKMGYFKLHESSDTIPKATGTQLMMDIFK
jgi:hypothetical protein